MADIDDFRAPKLGIGMIFSPALYPLLQRRPEALDLLEIEPQTLWLADHALEGPFFEFAPGIELFRDMPGHKLVHSVGVPLGGTRAPNPAQTDLLKATANQLNSPWISEHLSVGGTPHRASGFFLPPIQTDLGVETAVRNIRAFAKAVGRPVAIETGVAYLKRKPFEMPDGEFVARVAEQADCGILLDLHNIYCNDKNGRMSMDRFMADIPLNRVWEVHLAGGTERDGYWLDSHSGPMPDDLAARSLEIVKSLPNLGALNFEIYDTFLAELELPGFDKIVDDLRRIWNVAGCTISDAPPLPPTTTQDNAPSPDDWEQSLTQAVWKAEPDHHGSPEDRGPLELYSFLARSFRGSMVARALPRTVRYLLLRDGQAFEDRLKRYFSRVDPRLYTPLEAEAFNTWLREDGETDPLVLALLDFDLSFIKLIREGKPQIVYFPGNPTPVFEALAEARLPETPPPPIWEIEILPDTLSVSDFATNMGH